MIPLEGIFVYLCSGEVMGFPAATSVGLEAEELLIYSGADLLQSIRRSEVWFSSSTEGMPPPG